MKGRWTKEEKRKAARIYAKAEKKKSVTIKILDEMVHWLLLIIALLGNLIFDSVIIIISGLISGSYFYIMVVIIALAFGLMIEIGLKDIEKLSKKKHIFSRIMLIIIALINIPLFLGVKNTLDFFINTTFEINVILIGVIYSAVFLMPHFFNWLESRK